MVVIIFLCIISCVHYYYSSRVAAVSELFWSRERSEPISTIMTSTPTPTTRVSSPQDEESASAEEGIQNNSPIINAQQQAGQQTAEVPQDDEQHGGETAALSLDQDDDEEEIVFDTTTTETNEVASLHEDEEEEEASLDLDHALLHTAAAVVVETSNNRRSSLELRRSAARQDVHLLRPRWSQASAASSGMMSRSSTHPPSSTEENNNNNIQDAGIFQTTTTGEVGDNNNDAISSSKQSIISTSMSSSTFMTKWVQSCVSGWACFRPHYDLRTQLMLSFGSLNAVTICFVVLICCLVSYLAGQNVKDINSETFAALRLQQQTARYLADSLQHRLVPQDDMRILVQVVLDRFQGYPVYWQDEKVPFQDVLLQMGGGNTPSNTGRRYPIQGPPAVLDWQSSAATASNGNYNAAEHLQGRASWYPNPASVSTAAASFYMPGACNPAGNVQNCTDDDGQNNNITTGGSLAPNPRTQHIYRKASDLTPVLKALYEYNADLLQLGIAFANPSSMGVSLLFPHVPVDDPYKSVVVVPKAGCSWMQEPNPMDPRKPIGSLETMAYCKNEDEASSIPHWRHNPVTKEWFRKAALDPHHIQFLLEGPSVSADDDAQSQSTNKNSSWILSYSQGIYDRETKQLIGSGYMSIPASFLDDIMVESRVTPMSEASILLWTDQGQVLSSSKASFQRNKSAMHVQDLALGLTQDTFQEMFHLVNFSQPWDPVEARRTFQEFTTRSDGYQVSGYPIPPIPDEYDSSYSPIFFAVVSVSEEDVFSPVENTNEDVDDRVRASIYFSLAAGAVGLALATAIILLMARTITRPLQQINETAREIAQSFGDHGAADKAKEQDNEVSSSMRGVVTQPRCTPRTEISMVATEFNSMVESFSGSLMARTERQRNLQHKNELDLRVHFEELYQSRWSTTRPFRYSQGQQARLNKGRLVTGFEDDARSLSTVSTQQREPASRSTLFAWIVILICVPLLITTVTISVFVIATMNDEFRASIDNAKEEFIVTNVNALSVNDILRSGFVSAFTARSTRDLYLLTRYMGWLLFGALGAPQAVTKIASQVEECSANGFPDWEVCDNVAAQRVCDCVWNENSFPCQNYPNGSRYVQDLYYLLQNDGNDETGQRLESRYPSTFFSPETTAWFDNVDQVPGASTFEDPRTSFYGTSFDRLTAGAAVPLWAPLQNYDTFKENSIGHFSAFEADGLFIANEGCENSEHPFAAYWYSDEENGAADLRPELCPLGRYGYDPRCREWYHVGRSQALNEDNYLYITAPYFSAGDVEGYIAQSATAPLIDSPGGTYVGQVLNDWRITPYIRILSPDETPQKAGGFSLLITPEADSFGGDTVVGPNQDRYESAIPVLESVLPFDVACTTDECAQRRTAFEGIIARMKAGEDGVAEFERMTESGLVETVYMAFSPVKVPYLTPLNASDFARGAQHQDYLVLSFALAETRTGLLEPFQAVEREMERQLSIAIAILSVVNVLAIIMVVYMSYVFANSISIQMLYLLHLVRRLNQMDLEKEPPKVNRSKGSREILSVADTMESLFRAVRIANMAFYSGDLESAHGVLEDALYLFKKLDNKKAMGVACNNLGNTLLQIYMDMKREHAWKRAEMTRDRVVLQGIAYFHEAITLGEAAYETFYQSEGWTPNCLDFMQHLSNRYFNRAIFLLTVKDDHPKPDDIVRLGRRDLEIARDLDVEIVDQGEEVGWGRINRAEKLFEVALVRARGYCHLLQEGYADDEEWQVEAMLNDLYDMLLAERSKETPSDLFASLSFAGRLQLVEEALLLYYGQVGDHETCAKIAIRMLIEDEYILLRPQAQALKALLALETIDDRLKYALERHIYDVEIQIAESLEGQEEKALSICQRSSVFSQSLRFSTHTSTRTFEARLSVHQSSHLVTMEQF